MTVEALVLHWVPDVNEQEWLQWLYVASTLSCLSYTVTHCRCQRSAVGGWRRRSHKTQTSIKVASSVCLWIPAECSWRGWPLQPPSGTDRPAIRHSGHLLLPLGKHTVAGTSPRSVTDPHRPTTEPRRHLLSSLGNTEALTDAELVLSCFNKTADL